MTTLFHPPGVIRVATLAEHAARQFRIARSRGVVARAASALRRLARVWVEAQAHRCGI